MRIPPTRPLLAVAAILLALVAPLAWSAPAGAATIPLTATHVTPGASYQGWGYARGTGATVQAWRWSPTGWTSTTLKAGTPLWIAPWTADWKWAYVNNAWHALASGSTAVYTCEPVVGDPWVHRSGSGTYAPLLRTNSNADRTGWTAYSAETFKVLCANAFADAAGSSARYMQVRLATGQVGYVSTGSILAGAVAPAAVWKTLVLVFDSTNLTVGSGTLSAPLGATQRTSGLRAASRLPAVLKEWSAGYVTTSHTVVTSTTPLRGKAYYSSTHRCYWITEDQIAAQLDTYAPRGRYDSVLVLFNRGTVNWCGLAWSGWSDNAASNGAGVGFFPVPAEGYGGAEPAEVFVHEWGHQAQHFHQAKGFPRVVDIDQAGRYGYSSDADGTWRRFLSDTMTGRVGYQGASWGFPRAQWAKGTPTAWRG